jgi:hypothetical protein
MTIDHAHHGKYLADVLLLQKIEPKRRNQEMICNEENGLANQKSMFRRIRRRINSNAKKR